MLDLRLNLKRWNKANISLAFVLGVALFLRVWDLGGNPPHLRNDEAALGYNAYSILKTGRDEHGELLPLVFKSFGDWKQGLYVYLTLPFIASFGLNEFSVRLPSAISGVIAVWLIYKVVLLMFLDKRLAFISSVVVALSPLSIVFSRGAWEVNVSLTLTLAAILFFLKSIKEKEGYILLSAILFGLTLLASHTAKLSSPIILLVLIIAYYRQFIKIPIKLIILSTILGILISLPVLLTFTEGKITRLTTLSIFSYPRSEDYIQEVLREGGEGRDSFSYYLYHSEALSFLRSILSRWFSLYSGSTLFVKGDTNPQHTPPNIGPFLIMDSIFLLVGLMTLARLGKLSQSIFIWSTLLLLSLPSALTIEKANLERVLTMFIPLFIIIAMGVKHLLDLFISKKRVTLYIFITFITLYLLNYFYFLDQYFIHGPKKNDAWQYGYKDVVAKVANFQSRYNKVTIQQSYEHPYIFFLFYGKYDPNEYQKIVEEVFIPNTSGKDMGLVTRVGNIEFEEIDWSVVKPNKGELFVIPSFRQDQLSRQHSLFKLIDEVKDLNGFSLFKIIETI